MLERDRKLMEAQVKDMAAKVDEAEQNALKGGKKAMAKMESRIRELESEMDAESRRMNDAQKNLRRSERRIKELTYQQDEEAEEIAALNLAKFRQVQGNLGDTMERADIQEQALAKMKARARSVG